MFFGIGAGVAGLIVVGGVAKMVRDMIAHQKALAMRERKPWDLW